MENIVEAVRAANKTALSAEKIRPHMDNLTLQLLALSMLITALSDNTCNDPLISSLLMNFEVLLIMQCNVHILISLCVLIEYHSCDLSHSLPPSSSFF